jgi:hypothetical protein
MFKETDVEKTAREANDWVTAVWAVAHSATARSDAAALKNKVVRRVVRVRDPKTGVESVQDRWYPSEASIKATKASEKASAEARSLIVQYGGSTGDFAELAKGVETMTNMTAAKALTHINWLMSGQTSEVVAGSSRKPPAR